jgi:hypothetical protein
LWAVTSYYNPVHYKRRLKNYRTFRENLGVPLVTVELSFNDQFDLTERDADILIQISGGAILWQKERLLNLAIKSVPPDVDKIAWIDCDVIFERSDWVAEAKRQLDELNVVQLFSVQVDLNSEDHRTNFDYDHTPPSGHGIVSLVGENKFRQFSAAPTSGRNGRSYAWGMAWAARRTILEDHGLYDALIVGTGDRALVAAMYGQFESLTQRCQLNSARQAHYLKWARPYQQAIGGRVGYVQGRLFHLWHGDIKNRNYAGRHQRLAGLHFEPEADLKIGPNGAWHWARSRPDLEAFFVNYFTDRAEDG